MPDITIPISPAGSSPAETLPAYQADPPAGVPVRGGIVLIHEIWGLVEHIRDVADRYAAEGFVVVAPDILSHVGIDPQVGAELNRLMFAGDEAERTAAQPLLRERMSPLQSPEYGAWAVAALTRVVDHVAALAGVEGRIAALGFCFGGTYSFALAAADPRIRAAVPFYGAPPAATDIAATSCPILAFYGDEDENLMKSLPEVTRGYEEAGVDYRAQVYAGRKHAFFNDTNATTYDADAAADAWRRSLAFLDASLS